MIDLLTTWRPLDSANTTPSSSAIALCQEWATHIGGGEQVASVMAEGLDIEDVYVFAAQPELVQDLFDGRRVWGNGLGMTRFGREHWQWLLPFMGRAWRSVDLRPHDLVITSSYACVNSVRVPEGVAHISYCHSPMRYAWEWKSETGRLPRALRPLWPLTAKRLRKSDRERSRQVDLFLTNSRHVGDRIWRYYSARSLILYPPIDTSYWTADPRRDVKKDYLLYAGRLVPYKRPDIAVQAATELGVELVVAGFGSEYDRLRRMAGPSVRFVHHPTRDEMRQLYREARGLVFPGVEDFGMTLVEAQACGTPVIALNVGGAREAVLDGSTGLLYDDPSLNGLVSAIRRFDPSEYPPQELRRHAESFDTSVFVSNLQAIAAAVRSTSAEAVLGDPRFASLLHPLI